MHASPSIDEGAGQLGSLPRAPSKPARRYSPRMEVASPFRKARADARHVAYLSAIGKEISSLTGQSRKSVLLLITIQLKPDFLPLSQSTIRRLSVCLFQLP